MGTLWYHIALVLNKRRAAALPFHIFGERAVAPVIRQGHIIPGPRRSLRRHPNRCDARLLLTEGLGRRHLVALVLLLHRDEVLPQFDLVRAGRIVRVARLALSDVAVGA